MLITEYFKTKEKIDNDYSKFSNLIKDLLIKMLW